ncbi:putative 4-coumarate--CoA ligase 2 [Platanthera guangdongensis]|uniref:4-coumarate--CoA ligase 2 n=1 Tax=Platanthera guangdongensis TaxID=2320717 RepID=A0ABR2MP70_9ASPA
MISIATPELHQHDNSPAPPPATSDTIIFRSRLPDIPIANHLPLHSYCFENATNFAGNPCLISSVSGRAYSFAETHLLCRRAAAGLAAAGLAAAGTILLLLQNCPEFVFASWAPPSSAPPPPPPIRSAPREKFASNPQLPELKSSSPTPLMWIRSVGLTI